MKQRIVILAAGKGRRMNSQLPKVLVPLNGKPMIEHLLSSVMKSGVDNQPVIVTSPDNIEIIKNSLKNYNCEYVIQNKQLGTGHALASAQEVLKDADRIICLYGDHPFVGAKTIKMLASECQGAITIMTNIVNDSEEWQKVFHHWGRIVRQNGKIKAIVEFKDADDEIKKIKEVNPAYYCFDGGWLWRNIERLKNNNAQEEYYLTDLIKLAFEQGREINSIIIDCKEAVGVNCLEELETAKKVCPAGE